MAAETSKEGTAFLNAQLELAKVDMHSPNTAPNRRVAATLIWFVAVFGAFVDQVDEAILVSTEEAMDMLQEFINEARAKRAKAGA